MLIADATNLKSCLLLLTQLIDIQIPTILALNMVDQAARSGLSIDVKKLSLTLDLPVVLINARQGHGLEKLKKMFFFLAQVKRLYLLHIIILKKNIRTQK